MNELNVFYATKSLEEWEQDTNVLSQWKKSKEYIYMNLNIIRVL